MKSYRIYDIEYKKSRPVHRVRDQWFASDFDLNPISANFLMSSTIDNIWLYYEK